MIKKILLGIVFISAVFSSKAQEPEINHWESLFFPNAPLKYIIPNQQPSASWNEPGFDDSSWGDFFNALGSGEIIDMLVQWEQIDTLSLFDSNSIYTRTYFTITDTSTIEKLMLDIFHEDGMVAYINGVEVARKNFGFPGEVNAFDQLADTCLFNDLFVFYLLFVKLN